jgi:hypothetical protein
MAEKLKRLFVICEKGREKIMRIVLTAIIDTWDKENLESVKWNIHDTLFNKDWVKNCRVRVIDEPETPYIETFDNGDFSVQFDNHCVERKGGCYYLDGDDTGVLDFFGATGMSLRRICDLANKERKHRMEVTNDDN